MSPNITLILQALLFSAEEKKRDEADACFDVGTQLPVFHHLSKDGFFL